MLMLAAAAAFVGTHFLLSHPLRAPLARAIGEGAFTGLYSVVAIVTLVWMVIAYRAAPPTAPLWAVGDTLWIVVSLLMLLASVLLCGALVGNPALPSPKVQAVAPTQARGVYAVTRHPMLWAFALWGLCHILVFPIAKTFVVAGAIIVLSLFGAAAQDAKKRRTQPALGPDWERRTSYLPFAAILAGRARPSHPGLTATAGGLLFWLVATWVHIPASGWPAGIWRWI